MPRKRNRAVDHDARIGGLAFFLGLASLLALCLINFLPALALLDGSAFVRWRMFLAGALIGAWAAGTFVIGRMSIFLHEFKHSLVSNLAGNRAKGMKIKRSSGQFSYAYTADSAKYNALIALAPYFFPLFTAPVLAAALLLSDTSPDILLLLLGAVYGADLLLNLRDVSPVQTDLTRISGGYHTAVLFVAAMNLVQFSYLAAWVSQGLYGLKFMVSALFRTVVHLLVYYQGL